MILEKSENFAVRETARITGFINDFIESYSYQGVVLGLSGGLDSSVVAALCVKALTGERVRGLILPERDSSDESVEDAGALARKLGIECRVLDLIAPLEELGCYESAASRLVRFKGVKKAVSLFPGLARKGYLSSMGGGGGRKFREFTAFYRIKHRLRMAVLYRYAEENNLAVTSCANRTEHQTGFFVRYGDDSGDIAPVRHLYKSEVLKIGEYLDIPGRILDKAPSPDLFAGLEDEEVMGITYHSLDLILDGLSRGKDKNCLTRETREDEETIEFVKEMVDRSKPMREWPAVITREE